MADKVIPFPTHTATLRFRAPRPWHNIKIDRTIVLVADNTAHALKQAESYVQERSDKPAFRIVVRRLQPVRLPRRLQ